MRLESLIAEARRQGASDLHIEPGLPAARRIKGSLEVSGPPIPAEASRWLASGLLGEARWQEFRRQRSFDLSATIAGVRCRVNVLTTSRGVGMAIRLLSTSQPTLESFNLHPEMSRLVEASHGLVIVTGSTGSGKSSTLAALIHEVNSRESRHIVTIENPIEYRFKPRRSYIRQRQVGRDTPSFEQGLVDAMREDPDLLMVGEMRRREVMRLTLDAAETGHLVLTTLHSATCADALQRITSAFPDVQRAAVATQLADCLVAVVAQRLRFREELGCRVAECEILWADTAARALIRKGECYKVNQVIERGGPQGSWSFARYRQWLDERVDWFDPERVPVEPLADEDETDCLGESTPSTDEPEAGEQPATPDRTRSAPAESPTAEAPAEASEPIVIEPPEESLNDILRELGAD